MQQLLCAVWKVVGAGLSLNLGMAVDFESGFDCARGAGTGVIALGVREGVLRGPKVRVDAAALRRVRFLYARLHAQFGL